MGLIARALVVARFYFWRGGFGLGTSCECEAVKLLPERDWFGWVV